MPTRHHSLLFSFVVLLGLAPAQAVFAGQPIRSVTPMPQGRAFHGACVLADNLYVMGGSSYRQQGDKMVQSSEGELSTLMAPIATDGSLGAWRSTTPLPAPRHNIGAATVVLNDVVYLVGGTDKIDDGQRHTTILMNRPRAGGDLGDWTVAATFPRTGLSFTAAFATPGWLHIVGGVTSERQLTPATWSVEVKADGQLGQWHEGPALPRALWYHSAGVAGGNAYIFGGLETYPNPNLYSTAVYRAPLLGDGRMGPWQVAGSMPEPFYAGVPSSMGPYLMSFLGRVPGRSTTTGDDTPRVWWTTVDSDGLAAWRTFESPVDVRRWHGVATDYRRQVFYVVGGKNPAKGAGGHASVWCFTMSDQARSLVGGPSESGPAGAGEKSPDTAPEAVAAVLPSYFQPYQTASPYDDRGNTRPLVMYFMASGSRPTDEQNRALADAVLEAAAKRAVFATVDVTATPQVAQQRGILRVPSWLFFDSRGNLVDRKAGPLSAAELADRVSALR